MVPMTREEILHHPADPPPPPGCSALEAARRAMADTGQDGPGQQMGERWPVGCVALEITQRCNLDCTLCYLSDLSEAVRDLPLPEVFRRIDDIAGRYGPGTDVQVTGGDPTLRRRDELTAIVARVAERGMRPTLMTNGIRATRPLLAELAAAGLADVAFHVDTTQERAGYRTEADLAPLREKYIRRAAGLPLSVMFNTTVHAGNFHEVPDLVRFFRRHAGSVRTASFQLQADTGRGVLRGRGPAITLATVTAAIERGAGGRIAFSSSRAGHHRCNRYGLGLEVGGRFHDLLDEPGFIGRLQAGTAEIPFERGRPGATVTAFARWLLAHPGHLVSAAGWLGRKLRRAGPDLLRSRGRAHTLSFFVHDFMDACALDPERIRACVFKVATPDGPLSMCMYNAKRDGYILRPVTVDGPGGPASWHPLGEEPPDGKPDAVLSRLPPKRLKGRARRTVGGPPRRGSRARRSDRIAAPEAP